MVNLQSVLFVFSATFCMIFQEGWALHCFECNSHYDPECSQDIPPDAMKKDCASLHSNGTKYNMCRKITQIIEFEVNGLPPDSRVIRSCGWVDYNYKGRCYQRSGFGGRQEVCSCLTDFCNGVATPGVSIVTALLLPTTLVTLFTAAKIFNV